MGRGKFRVTAELLRSVLTLPDGLEFVAAAYDGQTNCVEFVTLSPDFPATAEGSAPADVSPTYGLRDGKPYFAGWGGLGPVADPVAAIDRLADLTRRARADGTLRPGNPAGED